MPHSGVDAVTKVTRKVGRTMLLKKTTFGCVSLITDESHWLTLRVRYNDGTEGILFFNPREASDLLNAAVELMSGDDDGSQSVYE